MTWLSDLRQRLQENPTVLHVAATVSAFLLFFSRRPDAILNPQFWAEDGKVWYADAYNRGIVYSLLTPEAGYYQTISRLIAVFTQLFPLAYAPLIFNLFAIGVKLLVINFLISSRMTSVVPSLWARIAIAFLFIALPHSAETHANLTNVQWHLALLTFLIIIAPKAGTRGWRIFDMTAVTISALSGPFCLLLLPIAAFKFFLDRSRSTLLTTAILAIGAIIQLTALLTTDRPSAQPLGAELGLAMKIIAGHLFLSALIGERGHRWMITNSLLNDITAAVINLAGFALIGYGFVRARRELRLMIVFSFAIFLTALLSPAISSQFPQWVTMWHPGAGSRYWLIPIFTFLITLVFLAATEQSQAIRVIACAALVVMLGGIAGDWKYPRFTKLDFRAQAERFEAAPAGETVTIPINPGWEMKLVKK